MQAPTSGPPRRARPALGTSCAQRPRRLGVGALAALLVGLLVCGAPRAASAYRVVVYHTKEECSAGVNGTVLGAAASGECLQVPEAAGVTGVASVRATCASPSTSSDLTFTPYNGTRQPGCAPGNALSNTNTNDGTTVCQQAPLGEVGPNTTFYTVDCSWVGGDGGERVTFHGLIDNDQKWPCRYDNDPPVDREATTLQNGQCGELLEYTGSTCSSGRCRLAAVVTCDKPERSSGWAVELRSGASPCGDNFSGETHTFTGAWDQCLNHPNGLPFFDGFEVQCGPGAAEPPRFSNRSFGVAVSQFADCVDLNPEEVFHTRNGACFLRNGTGVNGDTEAHYIRADCSSSDKDKALWRLRAFNSSDTTCSGPAVAETFGHAADDCLGGDDLFYGLDVACGANSPVVGDDGGDGLGVGAVVGIVAAVAVVLVAGLVALRHRKAQQRAADGARDWESGTGTVQDGAGSAVGYQTAPADSVY